MFKFNFNVTNENSDEESCVNSVTLKETNDTEEVNCYDCEEIKITQKNIDNIDLYKKNSLEFHVEDFKINYINLIKSREINVKSEKDIAIAETQHSDLIPGIYEGGAKIWECTVDLLEYLSKNDNDNCLQNKFVLDLGCGVGLLGIYGLRKGAKKVCFQDYNKDVIESITIPSVLSNENESTSLDNITNCSFYCGDWENFIKSTNDVEKFNFIFSSETIYNPKNYGKILNVFDKKLNENGVVYLAVKTYYFGIGGSVREFEKFINSDRRFKSEVVWQSNTDKCHDSHLEQNSSGGIPREILKIQRILCNEK